MHISNKYSPFGRGKGKWACWPYTEHGIITLIDLHTHPYFYRQYVSTLLAVLNRLHDENGRPRFYQTKSCWHGAHQKFNGAWHSGRRMKVNRRRANRKHRAIERALVRRLIISGNIDSDLDGFKVSIGSWD